MDGCWVAMLWHHQNDDEEERKKSHSQIQQLIDAAPREKDIDIYIYTKHSFPHKLYLETKHSRHYQSYCTERIINNKTQSHDVK